MNPGSSRTSARKSRVFIVDDHPVVREGLANLINGQDDLIVCGDAEDSSQAVVGIGKAQPDVALIDISLRNESGLDLVKKLQNQFPLIGLIVFSMHDESLYAERALRAGARGYVMKGEPSKSVLASIRRVLEGGVYVSERIINRLKQGPGVSRRTPITSPVERLSDRELEVFCSLGHGRSTGQIAADLNLSSKTIQTYYTRAKEKLGLSCLTELLRAAIRWQDCSHSKAKKERYRGCLQHAGTLAPAPPRLVLALPQSRTARHLACDRSRRCFVFRQRPSSALNHNNAWRDLRLVPIGSYRQRTPAIGR